MASEFQPYHYQAKTEPGDMMYLATIIGIALVIGMVAFNFWAS